MIGNLLPLLTLVGTALLALAQCRVGAQQAGILVGIGDGPRREDARHENFAP